MTSPRSFPSRRAVEAVVNAALAAQRRDGLADFGVRHPRLRQWIWHNWLNAVIGTLGDAVPPPERVTQAVQLALIWAISRLRPDGKVGLDGIDDNAWLHSTSWRPLLALACHHGLLTVPAFPARYRRHLQEAPVENLCGLWAVGPSTLYRYLDKAKRQLVDLFAESPTTGTHIFTLRQYCDTWLSARGLVDLDGSSWHARQADASFVAGRALDGLWHLFRSADTPAFLAALKRYGTEAAGSGQIDCMLEALSASDVVNAVEQVELSLRRANLWHLRHEVEREGEAISAAIRYAQGAGHPLQVGVAHAAMGQFLEERDRDRAMACFEQSIASFRVVIESGSDGDRSRAVDEYASCVVHLAWLYLRRNNPRAKALLDQVLNINGHHSIGEETLAALEQTWGEYWRCMGNPLRSLEHHHKALVIFQRLGHQRSIFNTYRNLSLIYSDAKQYELAIEYGKKVLEAATALPIEPEVLSGACINLGVAYFSLGELDQAINFYRQAIGISQQAGLRAHQIIVQYNLAEAHFERFKQRGDPEDESNGDFYAAAAARLSTEDKAHAQADAARALKREVLGTGDGPDRLLPAEHAAHFAEMAEVERLRLSLASPQSPAQQVRTHLAIARAYVNIATKERETALAIAARHQVSDDFSADLDELRRSFERELTREQQWDARWQQGASELLQPAQRNAALRRLMTSGAINKSGYAEVCGVSLATASKHLGLLADRGLLVQTGKGPSTRYLLPDSLN
ncbi:tetratricopeptide repeat protein [Ideonella sp. DXS29W]|uniref:Tetratricopeptide repeat protein n=1 Tax=Ideonella lacteola TaxID=2984193 RepID=A0ABU9BJK4_9BURK